MVPMAGLEPAQLAPPPPQDGVSTNFTTSACMFFSLALPAHLEQWFVPPLVPLA